ncbi:MAG: twin-arginine translocation pathway signal protein [Paracoccaceae bacterium]|nr:MAG: twin-arginine translocation pathway signal protein [Paracoccaceae bacterium]
MSLSRRRFIALIGGGTVLAATAAAAGFALTRTPHAALAPWDAAGKQAEPRLFALSHAILAPNPHNRQPWVAELSGQDGIRIYRDPERNLPHTDPHDRQLTIGMGCFLELLSVAASATGHHAGITLYPQGEAPDMPVADVRLTPGATLDPLFAHVLNRRSCKEPFAPRAVPASDAEALAPHARIITEPALVAELRALTWEAWMIEAETPHTFRESVDLMRFGKREILANPDGIDLGGPFLETLMLVGVLDREAQLDPASTAFRQGVAMYRTMLEATPAYAAISTAGNSRADQIAAGRAWMRLNLTTTGRGLSLHPVSQALQEFPEMAGPNARAHALLAEPGQTVQMLGRLGYGPAVPRTPRWPLETRLRNA